MEYISSLDRLRGIEHEWRRLEQRARPLVPFACYDWTQAWWTHLRESRMGIRDEMCIRALRSPNGELTAIAPLMTTLRPGRGPLFTRELQYFGSDPNITELRGMLVDPSSLETAHTTLLGDLYANAGSWDWLVLSGIPASVDLERMTGPGFPRVIAVRQTPMYTMSLPGSWAELKSTLGRNIKESIRRCYNAPKRDGISLQFDLVTETGEVEPALREFFRLHEARSEADTAVPHGNVFDTAAARRFLVDVSRRFAERRAFRLFRIRIAGKTVAARIGFVLGDLLYLYYSGYDPAFGKYSVMTTVVVEAIQYAIQQGFRTVNLSTGRDVSKTRWHPTETCYRELVAISPSLRGLFSYHTTQKTRRWLQDSGLPRRLVGLFTRRSD